MNPKVVSGKYLLFFAPDQHVSHQLDSEPPSETFCTACYETPNFKCGCGE